MREPIYRAYSRMSHFWELMCMKSRNQASLCDPRYLPIIFDHIVDGMLTPTQDCLDKYWSTNPNKVNQYELINTRYKGLGKCYGKIRNNFINKKLKNKAKTTYLEDLKNHKKTFKKRRFRKNR